MTVPASYDNVSLQVEPGPLVMVGDLIKDAAESIIDALTTINGTLNDLQLGWDGATAAEAHDFADQWLGAMNGMFGTSNDPKSGVMNQVIVVLMSASGNASTAENTIVKMFSGLTDSLTTAAQATPMPDTVPLMPGIMDPLSVGPDDFSLSAIVEINWLGQGYAGGERGPFGPGPGKPMGGPNWPRG